MMFNLSFFKPLVPVWVALLLMSLLACATPPTTLPVIPSTATQRPSETPRPSPTQTLVPSPTSTRIPDTPTPYPTLPPNGPYILTTNFPDMPEGLTIFSLNNDGRRFVPLLGEITTELYRAISPDNQWLVSYSGSLDARDLTLNIISLISQTTPIRISLLSPNYPRDLFDLGFKLPAVLPGFYRSGYADYWPDYFQYNFSNGIQTFAWSPTGRFLAFVSQKDGPSSDVYLLDLTTQQVQRLTSDPHNVGRIQWSPDEQWILVSSFYPGTKSEEESITYAFQLEAPDSIKKVAVAQMQTWVLPEHMLSYSGGEGPAKDLFNINIQTDQIKTLWSGFFGNLAIDVESKVLILRSYNDKDDGQYYLIDFNGHRRKLMGLELEEVWSLDGAKTRFLSISFEKIIGLDKQGRPTFVSERRRARFSISPNARWLLVYNTDGLDLHDENDHLVNTLPDFKFSSIAWQPDSQGFLAANEYDLYYFTVPNLDRKLIQHCQPEECKHPHGYWLP